jgi:drug/metabolite transporter (DMT)-like permease
MLLAAAAFASMSGCVHYLALNDVHPLVTGFFRSLLGFVFLAPWILRAGLDIMRTNRHSLFFLRGCASAVSQALYFVAVAFIPMADAVSLTFAAPLFATLLAGVVLGEALRLRRSVAMLIGFGGVLIVLRPGFAEVTWLTSTPLLAAVGMAVVWILVKMLSGTEPTERIVLYMVIYTVPFSLAAALFVWATPGWADVPWLIGTAVCGNLGQFAMTRAYKRSDATAVFPYDFVRLPFTALIAFFLFAQEPLIWTWIGAAVIFGSSAYITHYEVRRRAGGKSAGAASASRAPQSGK